MKYVPAIDPGRESRAASTLLRGSLAVCGILLLLSGCGALRDTPDPLPEILQGGEYQAWDEVRPAIKAHLIEHPDDALGHYLYGLSYLHLQAPQLTLAEGEFQTALHLLDKPDGYSEERTGIAPETFAARLHRKTALTYMRSFREAVQHGLPQRYGALLLQKAYEHVELGLAADPNSAHLKEYQQFLRGELGLDGPPAPEILTERAGTGGTI